MNNINGDGKLIGVTNPRCAGEPLSYLHHHLHVSGDNTPAQDVEEQHAERAVSHSHSDFPEELHAPEDRHLL